MMFRCRRLYLPSDRRRHPRGGGMLGVIRRRLVRLIPLVIATLVVGVGIYFVGLSAIDGMQRVQAKYAAESFGKYLVQQVPDLAGVVASGVGDPAAATALASFKPIGTILKFR